MYPLLWSRYFREELQQRICGRGSSWEDPHRVLLSYSYGSFFFFSLFWLVLSSSLPYCRKRYSVQVKTTWVIHSGDLPKPWHHAWLTWGHRVKIKALHFLCHLRCVPAYDTFSQGKKKKLENGIGRQKQQPDADLAHVPWPNRPGACPEHSAFHQDNLSPVSSGNQE